MAKSVNKIIAIIISEMRFKIVLKSMTGFGRSEEVSKDYKISVELRSVNHRYFDLSIKMPRKFSKFESEIRNIVKSHVQRGKLDLSLSYESYISSGTTLLLKEDILNQYLLYAKHIEDNYGIKSDMNISSVLRLPELISVSSVEEDEEFVWELIKRHIEQAGVNCADEHHAATIANHRTQEIQGIVQHRNGLFKVDNVNIATLAVDVRGHLRIPETGAVTKVRAGLEQFAHID